MISTLQRILATREVDAIAMECRSFKIGKTGQRVDNRYMNSDYPDTYRHIKTVYSGSEQDASDMESFLIDHYKDHSKCDNRKDGEASNNDDMTDAVIYHVYVV